MKFLNKLNKTITAIIEIVKNPWLLNKVLSENQVWDDYLNKKYSIKNGLSVIDITEISERFSEEIEVYTFLDGGSLPTDIALLQLLSKKFKDCSYFEIGTWRGESVANVSRFAKECYTLNLSDEELVSKEISRKNIEQQGFFSKGKNNIIHLYGNTMSYDFASVGKKFDVIFIDGDHHYEYVKNDTEKVFQHLVHENSIVVWHDYAFSPERVRTEVLAGILDGTPEKFRKNIYHISNTLCAVYMKGDFNLSQLEPPTVPHKKFSIQLSTKEI